MLSKKGINIERSRPMATSCDQIMQEIKLLFLFPIVIDRQIPDCDDNADKTSGGGISFGC